MILGSLSTGIVYM